MKKKHKSIYGAKSLLTSAQYLSELIIKKRADKKNIKLPSRFWTSSDIQYKYWKNALVSENIHANKILKQYDEDCVIKAFNSYECKPILTLKNKKLYQETKFLQQNKDIKINTHEHIETTIVQVDILPAIKTKTKSKRGRLK